MKETKTENQTLEIELIGGFTDPKGVLHNKVTFGNRLTVADLIVLDTDPQAQNPTQYQDLINRRIITGFGDLQMPVNLKILHSLNTIDYDDIELGADKFLEQSRGERKKEFRENNEVKIYFGFEIGGVFYDVVTFGNQTSRGDLVKADAFGKGVARECFLIGQQISKISTDDGLLSIEGQLKPDDFLKLDAEDYAFLRVGAELFRQSFRLNGKNIQRNDSIASSDSDEGNGNDGSGNSEST